MPREIGSEIRGADEAEPADEAGAEIRHDVAVEIREQQDVEPRRLHHELHAGGVDDALVVLRVRVDLRDAPGALEEQAVAELHDVRLVDRGDARAAVAARVLERELGDAP